MIITTKFKGQCRACGVGIEPGARVIWSKGDGVRCLNCRPNQDLCGAPLVVSMWDRPKGRCKLKLGQERQEMGLNCRSCPNDHLSFKCPKCNSLGFALAVIPTGQHETWFSVYCCRVCGNRLFSEEGYYIKWGELKR